MATATATTTYPDNMQIELRDVLCFELGYQDQIPNPAYVEGGAEPELIDNPQSKANFLQQKFNQTFRGWLKSTYEQGKWRQQTITEIVFE